MQIEMDGRVAERVTFNGREVDYFAGCGYLISRAEYYLKNP